MRLTTLALFALVPFEIAVALSVDDWLGRMFSIAALVIVTAAATAVYVSEQTRQRIDTFVGSMPRSVTLQRDDDGSCHALVTRVSGEPLVLDVPDEIAAAGPQSVLSWVFEQALD